MAEWLQWGTGLMAAWQAAGSAVLARTMESFTFLGAELFYMFLMPAVLWCYSASLGTRLGLALLLSAGTNTVLKLAFALPRPFWVDPRVRALSVETSFGLPSGHAQNAVVLWGYLAFQVRRWWATVAALVLILAISTSRFYLGMHFPGDIVAGWIVGAILLAVFVLGEEPLGRWLRRRRLATRLALAAAAALAMLALGSLAAQNALGRPLPAEWAENYQRALGEAIPFAPESVEDLVAAAGALLGFGAGAVLLDAWGGFSTQRGGWLRPARFFIGLVGVLVFQLGLDLVFPEGEMFRFFRYSLIGLWIAYGAPRAFVALRIA